MTEPAIRVKNLGKKYRLGLTHAGSLSELATRFTRRLRGLPPVVGVADATAASTTVNKAADFWALREVNFEVQPGEVVGIIGRNGAGKSTLLKVLSRVTTPTLGCVEINGRVGSLLEVGTGFHPELTGRENVFMNGTLLGMSRREVTTKLDEIVQFAGVNTFLDTPVKRYSSGMKVRLGFAVAAHLEPEVLIVDEVLAVGDAEFQKKCLGKMKQVAGEGRTVLFVGHNMSAIRRLCSRVILLQEGQIIADGRTDATVLRYLRDDTGELVSAWESQNDDDATVVRITAARLHGQDGDERAVFRADEPLSIQIAVSIRDAADVQIALRINAQEDGRTLFTTAQGDQRRILTDRLAVGNFIASVAVPADLLKPGDYSILLAAICPSLGVTNLHEGPLRFRVSDVGYIGSADGRLGEVAPVLPWKVVPAPDSLPEWQSGEISYYAADAVVTPSDLPTDGQ